MPWRNWSVFQEQEITPRKDKEEDERRNSIDHTVGLGNGKVSEALVKRPPEVTGHETILDLFRWPILLKYTIINALLW